MSESAIAQRPAATVEYLDPRTLLVDANIRTDLQLSKDFIASIKDLGVLVPIVAVRTAERGIRVRLGNRRTLGAIEADQSTVPVLVIADENTVAHWRLTNKIGQGHELACRLLGLENREALVETMASANDNRAQVIALALVLGAYEDFTSTDTWRNPTPQDREYFQMLVEWGYQLSDIEASIMGEEQASTEAD